MMLKTAFLSLLSHKNKTILLMIILSFGAFLTLIGISAIYTFSDNLRRGLTETMSGDIVIYNANENTSIDIVFPIQQIKSINDFGNILEILSEHNEVAYFTPLSKEIGLIHDPETKELEIGLPLIGANINDYINIFSKVELVEGEIIPEGKTGLLVSKKYINMLPDKYKKLFKVGDTLTISSLTKTGAMSIIESKIYGIIDIEGSDFAITNNVMDLKTLQGLVGYDADSKILTIKQLEALERNKDLLHGDIDEDSIFTEDTFNENPIFSDDASKSDLLGTETLDLSKYLTETDDENVNNNFTGETDFVICRVKDYTKINQVVKELNIKFEEKKLHFKAISYVNSSGTLGAFISLIGVVILVVILIIQVISIIIITNSVLMGVLDRVNEIGTMRAIGAQRRYIFGLIISESFLLSFGSAIFGSIISLIIITIFGSIGIKAQNVITGMLFAGKYLFPKTHILLVLLSFIIVIVVTLIATIYPLRIATKISPLEAMNKI